MNPADRPGHFRGRILEYGIQDSQNSSALFVSVRVALDQFWNGTDWDHWTDYDQEAYGRLCIIKGDGSPNNLQVEALIKHCGWDGDIMSIVNGTWKPTDCQVELKSNTYKDKTTFRVEWVNDFTRTPGGGISSVDPAQAKILATKYGANLRAIAASVNRNGAKPAGRPSPPPPPPPRANGNPQQQMSNPPSGESIPY